ncbi:MAG: FtsX-like permease family protein [Thermoguttaceae bacterium]|nr:FtsX-like permease family protein [Thermoguttaceae bacterium]MDW8036582.1 FtsX-like permease family protein [Thermoguttaceae bacterium]
MVLWKFTVRGMWSRPGRTALTFLSLTIGVAIVVAVSIARQTTRAAYKQMFASLSGGAALEVVADGGGTFDLSLLEQIDRTKGVQAAVPVLQQFTVIRFAGKRVSLLVFGVDLQRDQLIRSYHFVQGSFWGPEGGLILDEQLGKSLGLSVGDQVRMTTGRAGLYRLQVVGLTTKEHHPISVGYMPLEQLQELFGLQGQISTIQIVLQQGADREQVRRAIAQSLPIGLSVRPPATESAVARETMEATEQALRLASSFSFLLAAFIILNTFLMNVGERRRQLAVLRTVGATRWQIAWMVLRESLLLAVGGISLGVLVGIGGARLLLAALSQIMMVTFPPVGLPLQSIGLAAILGLGMALAGAAVPAYRASQLTPLEGMSAVVRGDIESGSDCSVLLGAAITLGSILGLAAAIRGWIPVDFAIWFALLLLIGVVLLSPLALGLFSWIAVQFFRPWLRGEIQLAYRQLLRHRSRSTLTVGVLFVATATGLGMSSTILDHIEDLRQWSRTVIAGDFFIRAAMPDMSTGLSAAIPEELGERFWRIPGVRGVGTARFVRARAAGLPVIVVARDFAPKAPLYLDLVSGNPQEVCQRVMNGEVVIGTVLAERAGLRQGDLLELETRQGPRQFRIAALANEYLVGGLAVYMDRRIASEWLQVRGVDAYVILLDPDRREELREQVRQQLEPICQEYGLLLESASELNQIIDNMSNGVNACLWGILILGFVVAAFGTVNTLTMNVLEQTREFGLLRIVAMTRRQLRKTILTQAAMIALMGLLPGAVAGVGVSWLMNQATARVTGHPVEFGFHPLLLLGCLGAGFLIVLAAGLIPAERAARLQLAEALQYE